MTGLTTPQRGLVQRGAVACQSAAQAASRRRSALYRPGEPADQMALHDPVAEVARPVQQLIAAARVDLAPGQATTVRIELHADLTCYTGRSGRRQVDPGAVELRVVRPARTSAPRCGSRSPAPRREILPSRVLEPQIRLLPAD